MRIARRKIFYHSPEIVHPASNALTPHLAKSIHLFPAFISLDLSPAFSTVDHIFLLDSVSSLGLWDTHCLQFLSTLQAVPFQCWLFFSPPSLYVGGTRTCSRPPCFLCLSLLPSDLFSIVVLNPIYMPRTPKFYTSSPDLLPQIQTYIFNCLLDISTWMSHRHFILYRFNTTSLILPPEPASPMTFFILMITTFNEFLRQRSWTPLFLLCPTSIHQGILIVCSFSLPLLSSP